MNFVKAAAMGTALAFALPASSQAATLVVDLVDVFTYDEFLDPDNIVEFYNIGAFSEVVGVAFDIEVYADDPSYLSEAFIAFTDSAITTGVFLTPGIGDDFPGTGTYSDSADLTALGLNFLVGADGLLRLEYAEGYDDFVDDWDGILNGTITFTYAAAAVPEPASWAMMIAGFGLIGSAMRRGTTRVRFAA
jgi:hypothetical protein